MATNAAVTVASRPDWRPRLGARAPGYGDATSVTRGPSARPRLTETIRYYELSSRAVVRVLASRHTSPPAGDLNVSSRYNGGEAELFLPTCFAFANSTSRTFQARVPSLSPSPAARDETVAGFTKASEFTATKCTLRVSARTQRCQRPLRGRRVALELRQAGDGELHLVDEPAARRGRRDVEGLAVGPAE